MECDEPLRVSKVGKFYNILRDGIERGPGTHHKGSPPINTGHTMHTTLTDVLTCTLVAFLTLYVLGTVAHWGTHTETLLDILRSQWRWLVNAVRR